MAGIGAEGAFGAAGTFAGLQDWMRQRRQQTVDAQNDTLFQQGQEDRATAKVQEAAMARQKLLEQQSAQRDQADMLAQIDGLDLPPLAKLGAKISVKQGKALPNELLALIKPKDPMAVDTVDANGKPVKRWVTPEAGMELPTYVAPKEPKAPIAVQTVDERGRPVTRYMDPSQALGQSFEQYREPKAPAGPSTEPLVAIKDPATGQPKLVPRSQAVGMTPASTRDQAMTEGQSNAAGFADRMKVNEKPIQAYEADAAASVGGRLASILPREMQSPQRQAYDAAKKNWIAAQLRKESGAAISEGEYAEADRQYFPQPGDTAGTIQQKRALRKVAETSMRRAAGHASGGAQGIPPDTGQGDDLGAEW